MLRALYTWLRYAKICGIVLVLGIRRFFVGSTGYFGLGGQTVDVPPAKRVGFERRAQ